MKKKYVYVIENRKKGSTQDWQPGTLCENSIKTAKRTVKWLNEETVGYEYRYAKYIREALEP